ncbi:MAG TPA: hypothetical protein VNA25_23090 [Phycisphaerae bacterium]|nr:hypothetical protein [Phycisphaerae bacterium]
MTYRFRKILERPDWKIPVGLSLEITYEVEPVEVPYDDDSDPGGGVSSVNWTLVAVRGPLGHYHQPAAFSWAEAALRDEPGLDDEIMDHCVHDYAERRI